MIGTNFGIFRPNNGSGGSAAGGNSGNATSGSATGDERSGAHLSDFMLQLEDYVPTIPDAVTAHYLNTGGFDTNDVRIVRLISVATQKLISDVVNDALQHCKIRTQNQLINNMQGGPKTKERKYTLTMEDLKPALADHGIAVRKADYFQ